MSEAKNAVIVADPPSDNRALMQIIERAAGDSTYDVEKLRALLAVKKEWEADEARKAFVVALNAFKANPPKVLKDKAVAFGAGKASYKHAGLDNASELIGAALAEHGISHRWNVKQEAGNITVTCILTHALGHSESVSMTAQADNSGSKNSIQAVGSAVSYLQRYTLFAASGIAPKDVDDDGRGGANTHEMDSKAKDEHLRSIEGAKDSKHLESLWAGIASECTKIGDVTAYEELKAVVRARAKALKQTAQQTGEI